MRKIARVHGALLGVFAFACAERPIVAEGPSSSDSLGDTGTNPDTETGSEEAEAEASETEESETNAAETEASETEDADPCDPVVFEDPMLEQRVRVALELTEDQILGAEQIGELIEFSAWHAELTNLAGLECATSLRSLDVAFNQIGDLSPIAELTTLEWLSVRDNPIATLPPLASVASLRHVSLHGTSLTDISTLAGAIELETLDVSDTMIDDLEPIAGSLELTSLTADDTLVDDLEFLVGFHELQFLRINRAQISDLSPLTGLAQLEYLELSGNPIDDLAPINTLPSLTRLSISDTGQADLSALSGLPLESLHAADNGIVDVTPVTTFTPPAMDYLDLSNNQIADLSPFLDTVWIGSGCGVQLVLDGNPVAASPTFEEDHPYMCELEMFVTWNYVEGLYCGSLPCP